MYQYYDKLKKTYLPFVIFLFSTTLVVGQQAVNYTQFNLNEYGLNPAVAGSTKHLQFMAGRRVQWRGLGIGTESIFGNFSKSFGKKGYKRYWHGVGAYVEQDKFGIFTTKSAFASYAIHLKLTSNYYLGFGIGAGVKSVALSSFIADVKDPALEQVNQKVLVPDIYPGLYLYSKKFTFGVGLRNIYKNTLSQGSNRIGTKGIKLRPTTYITISRKFLSDSYNFLHIPSIYVQTNYTGLPSVNFNFMSYYKKRVGLGINYRVHDAVSVILQVRVFSNVVVGFAYDYTISRLRYAKANTDEIMIGLSPMMSNDAYETPRGAADCPKFELPF
jgi:type IX secretion system PorP/SprF family membrane protein